MICKILLVVLIIVSSDLQAQNLDKKTGPATLKKYVQMHKRDQVAQKAAVKKKVKKNTRSLRKVASKTQININTRSQEKKNASMLKKQETIQVAKPNLDAIMEQHSSIYCMQNEDLRFKELSDCEVYTETVRSYCLDLNFEDKKIDPLNCLKTSLRASSSF